MRIDQRVLLHSLLQFVCAQIFGGLETLQSSSTLRIKLECPTFGFFHVIPKTVSLPEVNFMLVGHLRSLGAFGSHVSAIQC